MADTRVVIIGCGAVGSIFAAHLARLSDVEVWVYDVAEEHVRAINQSGLRVSGVADFTVRLQATTHAGYIPRCDFGIVATKSVHTRAAIAAAAHAFDQRSAVCSVQNGVGNEEIIAEHVRHVIRGTTFPAGRLAGPGHVVYDIKGKTWLGPFEPSGTPLISAQALADMLNHSGLETIALDDARGAQWSKLIFNAATNPVGALTGLDHQSASKYEPTAALFAALVDEGVAVARALGISLHDDPKKMIRYAAEAPGAHKASMLQDVEARRQTEVDFMNGAIVRAAEKVGVAVPLNRALWALVKGLELSWTKQ
jgi:2-dehydropantoate 2-reductase